MFKHKCSYLLMILLFLSSTYSDKCIPSMRLMYSLIHHPAMNREEKLPDYFQNTKDLILANGFGYEEHKVETEDGYVLTTHRIIGNNSGGPPLLIRPGASVASDVFLLRGRKDDLAFQLADAGFDVWLSDRRGSWYSREHVEHKPNSWIFWDFSFQESGYYDLPAVIDHIIDVTKYPQIFYLGHSMGTTEFFVMASLRPEYNAKLKLVVMFSPISITKNADEVTSPLVKLFFYITSDMTYVRLNGAYEVGAREKETVEIFKKCCDSSAYQNICHFFYGLLLGSNRNINMSALGTQVSHLPSGCSIKTTLHLIQLFKTGFTKFNYGADENLIRYNNITPPVFPLHKVTAPISFHWSLNDPFINEKAVNELVKVLPNVIESHKLEDPTFNHVDYLWGLNAEELLYKRVIKLFQSFS